MFAFDDLAGLYHLVDANADVTQGFGKGNEMDGQWRLGIGFWICRRIVERNPIPN